MVMDRRALAGQPYQGDDREAAVGFGVQDVLAVVVGVALALLGGEQIGGAEVGREPPSDGLADIVDERAEACGEEAGGRIRGRGGHSRRVLPPTPSRPTTGC